MDVNTDLLTAKELAEKLGGEMTAKRVCRWPTIYKDFPQLTDALEGGGSILKKLYPG